MPPRKTLRTADTERAEEMPLKVIDKKDMTLLVTSIMEEWEVVGPVAKDGKFAFGTIDDASQLREVLAVAGNHT